MTQTSADCAIEWVKIACPLGLRLFFANPHWWKLYLSSAASIKAGRRISYRLCCCCCDATHLTVQPEPKHCSAAVQRRVARLAPNEAKVRTGLSRCQPAGGKGNTLISYYTTASESAFCSHAKSFVPYLFWFKTIFIRFPCFFAMS